MELANPLEDGEPGSSEQRCNLVDVHLFTQEPHEPCVHLVCPSLVAVDWYHVLTYLNLTNGILDIKPSGQAQWSDGGTLGPIKRRLLRLPPRGGRFSKRVGASFRLLAGLNVVRGSHLGEDEMFSDHHQPQGDHHL